MATHTAKQREHEKFADLARKYTDYLAGSIGPRPSCRPGESEAAQYAAGQLRQLGVDNVHIQEFMGSPSSYARYALTLLITSVIGWAFAFQPASLAAGLLMVSGLIGAIAIILESDFHANWTRWFVRSKKSQNVISVIGAARRPERDIIVIAHLDTHRTPWFNASRVGQRLFRHVFRAAVLLQVLALAAGLVFLLTGWDLVRWAGVVLSTTMSLIGLLLIQADLTEFSPGAYDNASGVGSALALAARFVQDPPATISLWIVLTGCEETGSAGMQAFINRYARNWDNPLIINLDQMGSERLYLRTCEGFLIRRCVDPETLAQAREAARQALVELDERESQAYSDACVALQHGLRAISLGTQPHDPNEATRRHRLSDLPEFIKSEGLLNTQRICWALLRGLDDPLGSGGQHV